MKRDRHVHDDIVHPGQILLTKYLRPLRIGKHAFAEILGGSWSTDKVDLLINNRIDLSFEDALDLADALGTSVEFWTKAQERYDFLMKNPWGDS